MKFRENFPLPDTDWPPTRPFWEAAAKGQLAIPRCELCGKYVWYPEGTCRHCTGTRLRWTAVSGRGSLFSWVVVHRAFLPQLADQVPFVSALVSLQEDPGVRLVSRIVDCPLDALRIDMPLQVAFRPMRFTGIEGEVMAPYFAPAGTP
jgi:uncharacterized protein